MAGNSAENFRRWARSMSRTMALAALVSLAVSAWGVVQTLWQPEWLAASLATSYPQLANTTLSSKQALAALAVLAPQVLFFIWAASASWIGFGRIADTTLIDAEAAIWIRRSGLGLGLTAIAMILSHPLLSAIISVGEPAGHRFITLAMGTPELMTLLVSLVMFSFAHLMLLAADIDRDNKLIV